MPRTQSRATAAKHIGGLLKRVEDWDCTSLSEDEALRVAHRALRAETITSRQHTAVMAALRLCLSGMFNDAFTGMHQWEDAGQRPLNADELYELCEKLNGSDMWLGVRE